MNNLVLSGGGPNGMIQLGVLHTAIKDGTLGEIKTLYAVSAGAFIGTAAALRIPIETISDYFIERPWDKWIKFTVGGKGFVNSALFRDALLPLLNSGDISPKITIGEVYNTMGVELHIFVTNVSTMESTDLFQFPELQVVDAISMSCALFPLFTPLNYNEKTYMDGGYSCNFPIEACLATHDPASIFAVNICPERAVNVDLQEADLARLFEHLMMHMAYRLSDYDRSHKLALQCPSYIQIGAQTVLKASVWTDFLESKEHRREMFTQGTTIKSTRLKTD